MEKINACIVSFFMDNLNKKTIALQNEVVKKRNKSQYPHYSIHTDLRHGASMDIIWAMNGLPHPTFKGHNVAKKFDHDVVLFLDIDAIPLNNDAIDTYIECAQSGFLIGNIQRSNHIQNDQHLFAAPSAVALSVDTIATMQYPSALETLRADVGEEYTFAAEKYNIPIRLAMPLKFDEAPAECASWALKDGMPVYGRGTTFGFNDKEAFWHSFQSFHPGQQEKFWKKCEEELAKE